MDLNDIPTTAVYKASTVNPRRTASTDMVIICRNEKHARQVFDYFTRSVGSAICKFDSARRTVSIGSLHYMFISEAKEDVVLIGRRNAQVIRGEELESTLDRWWTRKVNGENG